MDADGPESYLTLNDQASALEMRDVLCKSNRQFTPEHMLCQALLRDALESLRLSDDKKHKREVKQDAIDWFRGATECLLSFEAVCDLLNLNADAVRKRALDGEIRPKQYNKRDAYWEQKKRGRYNKNGAVDGAT